MHPMLVEVPGGGKILVADDDVVVRELVVFRLEMSGYEIIEANDGEEAVRLAAEHQPALIIMDVMMPRLNGFEACAQMRENPLTAQIPVLLLTAKTMEADVERGFSVGANDYIKKPFSPQELAAKIKALLAR
jgi:DNA-binding response OmpR family regulator